MKRFAANTGPSQRINPETIPHLAGQVMSVAQKLSQALGYYEFQRLQVELAQQE
ncbi:MAG: hypothetical protein HY326_14305 [Chloroflexi bacterium]|nr:hypothetical protein [Chloroflexota bacterium]